MQFFAVKQILSSNKKQDFEREVATLRRMSKHQNRHLTQLLATYQHRQEYYLVFPWADGDLYNYWKSINPNPVETQRSQGLLWLAGQCEGLAEGLSYIHRHLTYSGTSLLYHSATLTREPWAEKFQPKVRSNELQLVGRHGDIKPQNILWFKDSEWGTLKITDFGITEFSRQDAVDRQKRGPIASTRTYAPPETYLDLEVGHLSPLYDIWSLGCVYLEFLAWWFGGWNMVSEFAEARLPPRPDVSYYGIGFKVDAYFDTRGQGKAVLKQSVSEVSISR